MQLSRAFLQLVQAPLDLWKVFLSERFKNSHRTDEVCDFYLMHELVEAALEHTISSFLTAASEPLTACRHRALDIQAERAKDTPVDILVLLDPCLAIDYTTDLISESLWNFPEHQALVSGILPPLLSDLVWEALNAEETRREPLVESVEVQDEHYAWEDSIERAKKATDIPQIVQDCVRHTLKFVEVLVVLELNRCARCSTISPSLILLITIRWLYWHALCWKAIIFQVK